ncbi:acetyltransferase [Dyadobacter pollutisoli]|jgi:sugar O-acyltransferase (sialic acid O-acetyltransferase NeuD family)|uniref:Acetyltransferase n=1 Tax=Dyadobacter pollutisoli TaxID=2910158 RepID=A0A9E8NAA8_9BACT|nr:acetyltransferase [Dyadobacter pollutisoli]WAC10704.1 acetyltransferase [Dyadobacter pollutisoli]
MIIYGAGGHAKVVCSILADCDRKVTAILDDNPNATFNGMPTAGGYQPHFDTNELIIIAIGDNTTRKTIAQHIVHSFGNVIHPSAVIASDTVLGNGLVIVHRAVVQTGTILGNHIIVNTGAIIDHDCILGDFVHVAPGAVVCGNVRIGENTLIGAGSTILPNLEIGKNCIIGAGSVITRSIPDCATVWGNPGRIIRF